MRIRLASLLCLLAFVAPPKSIGQTGLSQNSGINSADTWVTANITISGSGTVTLPSAFYNPQTGITSSTLPVATSQNFNLEAGYDINGGLVVNLYPTAVVNPATSDASLISCIRYAGGQMSVFDQSGNPLPMVMPNPSVPIPTPLAFLGTNPGASVITGLVVPNIQTRATAINAQVAFSNGNSEAMLTPTLGSGESAAWSYALSGSNWIAQSMSFSSATASATTTRTVAFSGLSWSDNAANDAVRAEAAVTVAAPPPPSSSPLPTSLGTPPADAAYTANFETVIPTNCNTNEYPLGGPQNVVMVHGLNSSSCTWTRMANWLNQDFRFGTEIIPSLPANLPLGQQGAILAADTLGYPGSGYIFLGHSQGGLASRSAAQYFQTNYPAESAGVITIDSPNNGADFATNGFIALSFAVAWGTYSFVDDDCFTAFDNMACYIASAAVVGGAIGLNEITSIQQSVPDLVPGSGFLSALNVYPETFNRAAVIGYPPQRWLISRVMTEWIAGAAWSAASGQLGPEPCNPEDSCGERAIAQDVEAFYDAIEIALVIDIIVDIFWPPAAAAIPYLVNILKDMDIADAAFDLFMDFPGDGSSDGIVDGPGQIYNDANPGAVQYPINNADSHSAALKSTYDRPVLDTILENQFHVPTQATCTFGASPTSLSPSALATSGSFNVLTAGGCQWSAFSNAPWLSISSGINGISNGAVDYAVQANPSVLPRQGAIQVGNGLSSTTLAVLQAGVCTYTLSPGGEIAVPPAGTNVIVSVTTQVNCPWSVQSNSSWLSINSGVMGTGSGSFGFTAAPNPNNVDRSGLITLMGQTLSASLVVLDGIVAGTPGVGTITIMGSPRRTTYNVCPPSRCNTTVYEDGTLTITVAGMTFEVPYGNSSDTTSTIASSLATQMNYPMSPISATVSGAKITITSTINGAGTNFPLIGSFTFNPDCLDMGPCFSSPAFTTFASGPNLAGGTD